nr:hypothetical protein [Tanacetum cinerariifolium]
MSTLIYVDLETITQADGAQSSRVPVSLPDDPYVAVRHAQLVDTNTELELEEAPLEVNESHVLGSKVPLMSEEFEASEPSGTRTISSYSLASSDSTTSLSPNHPLTHASPTPTPTRVLFHRRTTRMGILLRDTITIIIFEPSHSEEVPGTSELILDTKTEDESLDSDAEGEGSEDEGLSLDDEGHDLEDEGLGSEEEEEFAPEGEGSVPSTFEVGQSFWFMPEQEGAERISVFRQPTLVTWVDPEDGRVYTDILTYVPPAAPVLTQPSP